MIVKEIENVVIVGAAEWGTEENEPGGGGTEGSWEANTKKKVSVLSIVVLVTQLVGFFLRS